MAKYIEGDEVKDQSGRIGRIVSVGSEFVGVDSDRPWAPMLLHYAKNMTLHSRHGFRVGDKVTLKHTTDKTVYSITELCEEKATLEYHHGTIGSAFYESMTPYVEPPRPRWEAHNGEDSMALISLGNWYVHYSDLNAQRQSARFTGPNAENRAKEYADWMNVRAAEFQTD